MSLSRLKHSGLLPSQIAMGCEPLGGTDWGYIDFPLARSAVQCALDMGVTVFDIADVYGLGRGEEELSIALGGRRHEAFIITKFGVRWQIDKAGGRARTFRDASPAYLKIALENSLRRLRIDAIPLYLVHWPDPNIRINETLAMLEDVRREGKILNYGLSNFDADVITEAAAQFSISAVEGSYNLIERKRSESMFRVAGQYGIARFAYGPLAQGLLTGKYDKQTKFGLNDRRKRLPQFAGERWDNNSTILNMLSEIACRYQKTPAQTAIRWALDSGYVDAAIVGANSPSQIESNVGALNWKLSPQDFEALNAVSGVIGAVG